MKYLFFKIIGIIVFMNGCISLSSQENHQNWSVEEKEYYNTIKGLAEYIYKKDSTEIDRDYIFDKFIEFGYVFKDTSETRIKKRLQSYDFLFANLKRKIDSIGISNLDVKPIRHYKNHEIHRVFEHGLSRIEPMVMAYYAKNDPNNPLGALLFDRRSKKLLSWILLKQGGGSGWFLTFDLMYGHDPQSTDWITQD